jgi:DMSO/TMAO reductase YedYZ heme-binding membrane subunit
MSASLATLGPTAYWYLARGTGAVALVLLTVSVVLGILGSLRFTGDRWPRFALDTVHRDVSLLVIVFLVIHIATSVLDAFAPISLIDGVIPLHSSYRPLWLGLGALSFDLLIAIAVTSLMRRRLGYEPWRAIHWLAYASWPVAVLHGLGTGSDTKVWWMLLLNAACLSAVVIAVAVRISNARPESPGVRSGAVALAVGTPIALVIFTLLGPLQTGWARKAGTPASLLAHHAVPVAAITPPRPAARAAGSAARATGPTPKAFSASLTGSITQTQAPGGALIDLNMRLRQGARGRLRIRLAGAPIGGGGLSLTGSQVDLIEDGLPSVLQGQITSLQGDEFVAQVRGSSGPALRLRGRLSIDSQANSVTGILVGAPL